MAIGSLALRKMIAEEGRLKHFIDLIFFNRAPVSEQCFFTLNNFLLEDRSYAQQLIDMGICKAICSTIDKIKMKPAELLAEMFWTIHYLLDFSEECVLAVISQIPHLVWKLTQELSYEGGEVRSEVNKPIMRILGNLLSIPSIPQDQLTSELIGSDIFQTFVMSALLNDSDDMTSTIYRKESLWLLSNILGGASRESFEILLENKHLVDKVCEIAVSRETGYPVKKEALVVIYNMCENHGSSYMQKVMARNPQQAFFDTILNYQAFDPYTLKVAISFCSLACEKYGQPAAEGMVSYNIPEMVENIASTFAGNQELVALAQSLLETYLYQYTSAYESLTEQQQQNQVVSPMGGQFNI